MKFQKILVIFGICLMQFAQCQESARTTDRPLLRQRSAPRLTPLFPPRPISNPKNFSTSCTSRPASPRATEEPTPAQARDDKWADIKECCCLPVSCGCLFIGGSYLFAGIARYLDNQ